MKCAVVRDKRENVFSGILRAGTEDQQQDERTLSLSCSDWTLGRISSRKGWSDTGSPAREVVESPSLEVSKEGLEVAFSALGR